MQNNNSKSKTASQMKSEPITQAKAPVLFYKEGACSLGAIISLLWLDRPFYLCRVEEEDMENRDFLTVNPMGEVPTLYLDGTILTENSAILQHIGLEDLAKKITYRPGTPEFDQLNRALSFLTSSFHKAFYPLYAAEDLVSDKKAQEEIVKNTVDGNLKDMFQYANDHLLRTPFMFDHPMIIDAYFFAMARWGDELYDIATEFPHIKRFQNAMAKNEKVQFALAIESGKIKGAQGNFLGHKEFKSFVKEASARKLEVDEKKGDGEYTPGLKTEPASTTATLQNKKSGAI
jgi:glutathione S-transferase